VCEVDLEVWNQIRVFLIGIKNGFARVFSFYLRPKYAF
jgi:hypothetical protein